MVILTAPDGAIEIRHIPIDWARVNVAVTITLDAVADSVYSEVELWSSETWLEVDIAGGGYNAVGATQATAASLGAFTAGQRKEITLRLTVPPATSIRRKLLDLNLGLGT